VPDLRDNIYNKASLDGGPGFHDKIALKMSLPCARFSWQYFPYHVSLSCSRLTWHNCP